MREAALQGNLESILMVVPVQAPIVEPGTSMNL